MTLLFLTSTLPRFEGDAQAPFVLEQAAAFVKATNTMPVILAPGDAAAQARETLSGVAIRRFQYFLPKSAQTLAYPAILPNLKAQPLRGMQLPFFIASEYVAARKVLREKPDIEGVYAHWVAPQGLVAWALKKATGVPYVLQNHSSDLAVFWKLGGAGRAMARRLVRDASVFFCVNVQQKRAVLGLFPQDQRTEISSKIKVLPMGVAHNVGDGDGDASAEQGGDGKSYEFGFMGRLSAKKGVAHLLRAHRRLVVEGQGPKLGVAGDGEARATLKAAADPLCVSFEGFLSGAQKSAFLARCRTLVFPSIRDGDDVEGLPVAVLEALSLGKTVIVSPSTNIKMLPEWSEIEDDVHIIDDPSDDEALAAVMRRSLETVPAAVSARHDRLRRIMARYRWENLISEYIDTLSEHSVLSGPEINSKSESQQSGKSAA
ncbi:MAG: glycosyltransferase [Pseudomonadota bacterium]